MPFQINEDEREALRGLPMLAREIYFLGLRPFMDYASGVVGVKRGISWKSIAEELYVEPHQGIKGGEPTEKELRRALAWLQKEGLVGPNQADRRLVFELLLATRDKSVSKKVGSKWADEEGREAGSTEASNYGALQGEEGGQLGGGKTGKVGTPPVSDLPTSSSARFPMHDDWVPSARGWPATCLRNALKPEELTDDRMREFRSFWINQPGKHQSQGQWEHELAQSIKRQVRHAESNRGRTGQGGPNSGPGSLADELHDTSWADRIQLPAG